MENNATPEYKLYGYDADQWEGMTTDERNLTRKYYEYEKLSTAYALLKEENQKLNLKMQQFLSNEQEYGAELKQLTAANAELKKDKTELVAFLQEVDDKVKLGNLNLKSYYLLNKHSST